MEYLVKIEEGHQDASDLLEIQYERMTLTEEPNIPLEQVEKDFGLR